MKLNQRVFLGFHATMGGVYLGVIGSELAGWYEARDAIVLSGLALCGMGFLTWRVLVSTGRRRVLYREALGPTCAPSTSGLDTANVIWARRPGSYGRLPGANTRQRGQSDPIVPLLH